MDTATCAGLRALVGAQCSNETASGWWQGNGSKSRRPENLHTGEQTLCGVNEGLLTMGPLLRVERKALWRWYHMWEGGKASLSQLWTSRDMVVGAGVTVRGGKGRDWCGGDGTKVRNVPTCWATLGKSPHLSGIQSTLLK
jgi:hypothetical protein